MALNRRQFLIGSSSVALAIPAAAALQHDDRHPDHRKHDRDRDDAGAPLKARASKKGILYGTAISSKGLNDAPFASLVAEQCEIGVPEAGLKWDALRPSPDQYNFFSGDALYQFLNSHGMKYRGHTLVWEQALPGWFNSVVNARNAKSMMVEHISKVVGHYAGKMHSWDVVNEVLEIDHGRPDGLKKTPWLEMIGPEYIEIAFHAAHEADPKAMLVYNENWLEPEDHATDQKREAALNLLTGLKKKGVPIHGLGLQSHLFAETNVGGPKFDRFLQQVTDLGLEVLITEMDIRDQHLPQDIRARDEGVAKKYYEYLSFVLRHKSVRTVLTWGLSDRYTWITQKNPRPDGAPVRPLPYDAELDPTPAWKAIATAFDEAGPR